VAEPHVMAIDLGTGSCRALIFDARGDQVAMAQREWSHPPLPGAPGSQQFETARNWPLICECTREALAKSGLPASAIKGVASTAMREGMVLYDEAGREIWACPNVDSRAGDEAVELIQSGLARRIFDTGGDWVSITSPARFLWIRNHEPETFKRAAHVGMLSDWVATRLSGKYATDPSIGASSGLFDLARETWSAELIRALGLSPDIFPEVLPPGTVLGGVTDAAAAQTGLAAGTPVVVGGADTQLGLLGIGRTTPNAVTVVGGSFWQTTVVVDRPLIDPQARLRSLCHVIPGQWMVEGIGFYCGLTMRWFRDAFCDWEKEKAAQRNVDPFVVMEEEAATVPPGSNGVIPIFGNVMDAKRWVQASPSFMQFDIENPATSGRKECIRAIEESAGYVALGHLQIIRELTSHSFDEIVFTGGGSKGHLWPQVIADVLGVAVKVPVVKESTALGAALCAGVGAGLFADLAATASEVVRFERTFQPDAAASMAYQSLYEHWHTIYGRMLQMGDDGLLRPLWKPAGA
jgi:autoinducer 2 (AI-2) kinase